MSSYDQDYNSDQKIDFSNEKTNFCFHCCQKGHIKEECYDFLLNKLKLAFYNKSDQNNNNLIKKFNLQKMRKQPE